MDSLVQSCEDFSEYPRNLIYHDALSHNLRMYFNKLRSENTRIFQNSHAAVDFLDLKVENDGMYLRLIGTVVDAGETTRLSCDRIPIKLCDDTKRAKGTGQGGVEA